MGMVPCIASIKGQPTFDLASFRVNSIPSEFGRNLSLQAPTLIKHSTNNHLVGQNTVLAIEFGVLSVLSGQKYGENGPNLDVTSLPFPLWMFR